MSNYDEINQFAINNACKIFNHKTGFSGRLVGYMFSESTGDWQLIIELPYGSLVFPYGATPSWWPQREINTKKFWLCCDARRGGLTRIDDIKP